VGGLTLSGYILLLVVGERVLNLLIGHGGVTADNVHTLWLIMVALAGFFIGGTLGLVTSTTFYAMGDTRTPTRLGIVTYTIYIPVKILAFRYYGLIGLSVSISIFVLTNWVLQVLLLERNMRFRKAS
jgi:peptidoglycan biosynthesis protein MviN/MurJ (putative lipid II flippase)